MCPTQKWRQNFHLSDSESPIFFDKKPRHGKLSKKKLHCFEMSQTRQSQLDTLKNNRLLTLKASHALIFYRKNSGFHYLKDENFAFVSALSSFKNSSSFRSYIEKNPKLPCFGIYATTCFSEESTCKINSLTNSSCGLHIIICPAHVMTGVSSSCP